MGKSNGKQHPEVLDAAGTSLQHQGKYVEAIPLHRQALNVNPNYAPAHHNLGNALLATGDFTAARASFERALTIAPQLAASHNGRGVAFHRMGDLDEAIASFRRALEHRGDFAEAANNLGVTLRERGDMDEAIALLRKAVKDDPRNGRYLRHLVDSLTITAGDEIVSYTEELARAVDTLTPESGIEALFAHGKVMLDLGRYDVAFASLNRANALKRQSIAYDETTMLRSFRQLAHTFSPELLSAVSGSGNPSARPIFVIGMPRSGTTLVETLLAAHPEVRGGGELVLVERCIAEMPPLNAASTIGELRTALFDFGSKYIRETDALARGARHLTDKMPFNFRFVPMMHTTLPNAKIIHIRRDPLDVALSCYSTFFVDNVPFSYDLAELGHYYRAYEELMTAWRNVLPPDAMLEISYEELVTNFEAQARRILAYCNLDWNPQVLEFHRFRHPVRSASQSQVRRPLYASSVGRAIAARSYLAAFEEAMRR